MLGGGGQRGKSWDNCNSIINKIQFKKKFLNEESKNNHFFITLKRTININLIFSRIYAQQEYLRISSIS